MPAAYVISRPVLILGGNNTDANYYDGVLMPGINIALIWVQQ